MSNPQGYPEAGERVGPFRVERRLGDGGMGVVYLATQEGLDRRVALKIIAPQWAHDAEFRERFLREARAQAALDSPHVVHVYHYGDDLAPDGGSRLYLATQLVDGGDLERSVRERGIPPPEVAVDLVAQVALGLADAHAVGLVHRDVKPSNVLLRERDGRLQAFLGDFGIARSLDSGDSTLTSTTVGTPRYMAPELHTGGVAGVASDVYSLGCLLWWTLVGQPPFSGGSDFEIVSAHVEAPVPQLPDADPWASLLNPVLSRAMAKAPGDRYRSARAVHDDLRLALAGRVPAAAEPPGSGATAVRRAPAREPRRAAAGLAALLVAAVLAGGGWWLWGRDSAPDGSAGRRSGEPTSSGSATQTVSPTEGASSPVDSTGGVTPPEPPYDAEDRRLAERSLREALVDAGTLDETQAACVATSWVESAGLEAMVADGLFDERWGYHDKDVSLMSTVNATALSTAAVVCAT